MYKNLLASMCVIYLPLCAMDAEQQIVQGYITHQQWDKLAQLANSKQVHEVSKFAKLFDSYTLEQLSIADSDGDPLFGRLLFYACKSEKNDDSFSGAAFLLNDLVDNRKIKIDMKAAKQLDIGKIGTPHQKYVRGKLQPAASSSITSNPWFWGGVICAVVGMAVAAGISVWALTQEKVEELEDQPPQEPLIQVVS